MIIQSVIEIKRYYTRINAKRKCATTQQDESKLRILVYYKNKRSNRIDVQNNVVLDLAIVLVENIFSSFVVFNVCRFVGCTILWFLPGLVCDFPVQSHGIGSCLLLLIVMSMIVSMIVSTTLGMVMPVVMPIIVLLVVVPVIVSIVLLVVVSVLVSIVLLVVVPVIVPTALGMIMPMVMPIMLLVVVSVLVAIVLLVIMSVLVSTTLGMVVVVALCVILVVVSAVVLYPKKELGILIENRYENEIKIPMEGSIVISPLQA